METRSAAALAAEAAGADTPERKLAALVTLEAIRPGGILRHPETVLTLAESISGAPLAAALEDLAQRGSGASTPKAR